LTAATLGFYRLTLRAIAKSCFALVLILLWPAMLVALASVRTISDRWPHRPWQLAAGVSLGVTVIKPHLAIAMAVYAIARRWIAVIAATVKSFDLDPPRSVENERRRQSAQ
jgi:hypothetical protein